MEEVAAVAHMLSQTGIISALEEQVQFARARFGTYDTIDFVIVLVSYALSGEPTIAAFYDRLAPFADDVAALFHRQRLPSRSALSRFLAALDEKTLEALRTQFLSDLFERATPFSSPGGLWDRRDQQYVVVDVDGTRQAARQRALPHLPTLPEPHRRLSEVAVPGYTGRKRGEVVRTRTTILQAHTHQWLGTDRGEQAMGICVEDSSVLARSPSPMRRPISFSHLRSCSASMAGMGIPRCSAMFWRWGWA